MSTWHRRPPRPSSLHQPPPPLPHPLQPYFLIKLQTDGSLTPVAALEGAATQLISTLASLENKFKREFAMRDVDGGAGAEDLGAGGWAAGQGRDYMDF